MCSLGLVKHYPGDLCLQAAEHHQAVEVSCFLTVRSQNDGGEAKPAGSHVTSHDDVLHTPES